MMITDEGAVSAAGIDVVAPSANIKHPTARTVGSGEEVALTHLTSSQFDHMSWGRWTGTWNQASTAFLSGDFIVGRPTLPDEVAARLNMPAEMPKSGTAIYTGTIQGRYAPINVTQTDNGQVRTLGNVRTDLGGTVSLTAIFNTSEIGGGFSFKRGDGSNLVTAQLPRSNGKIDGVHFTGAIIPVGDSGRGVVHGYFYGPQAQEVGGYVALVSDNVGVISGVFGAKDNHQFELSGYVATLLNNSYYDWISVPIQTETNTLLTWPITAKISSSNPSVTFPDSDEATFNHTVLPSQQDFDYMSWGAWGGNITYQSAPASPVTLNSGYFIMGRATTPAEMPISGTATYAGIINGEYIEQGVRHNDLGGTANLVASFDNSTIAGIFRFDRGNGSSLATAVSDGKITQGVFTGPIVPSIAIGSGNGAVSGRFYGPQGEEVGGVLFLNLFQSNTKISGAFGAKRN